jgi:replicative DNA helicase
MAHQSKLASGDAMCPPILTGYKDFDQEIGGLAEGELVMVGSRPSMGKTLFLTQLALHVSKSEPVMYVSHERTPFPFVNRFYSCLSGIELNRLRTEGVSSSEMKGMEAINEELYSRKLYVTERCRRPFIEFMSVCRRAQETHGIRLLIIDGLQALERYSAPYGQDHLLWQLGEFALNNKLCVIVSSQLTRDPEERGGSRLPRMYDIPGCGDAEAISDMVILLHRPAYYDIAVTEENYPTCGLMEVIVAKNRHGQSYTIRLRHDWQFTRLSKYTPPPPDPNAKQIRDGWGDGF